MYLSFKKSLKKYLEINIPIVAAIDEEKDTIIIAFRGSKIMPDSKPNMSANGNDSDSNIREVKK